MKPLYRGLIVGVLQCAIVLSMTAKYQWDRERLPRAWAKVAPVDPNAPIRGRYLLLRLEVNMEPAPVQFGTRIRLEARNGELTAVADDHGALTAWRVRGAQRMLTEAVPFFLSDAAKDPTRLKPGEELWVEASVPPNALPRPLRLAIKNDNSFTPLALN